MTLSVDEIKEVLKILVKCNINLNQGVNYYMNSEYDEGTNNLNKAIKGINEIISKIKN